MSTQQYRGYHIDVQSFGDAGVYRYVMSVLSVSGGVPLHGLAAGSGGFPSGMAAEDEAFTSARAWIERHPARHAWD